MSNNMKPITYTILTKKQKEELQKLTEELMNLSTEVVEDYELNPSEISGSIIEINQNSPFLDKEFKGNKWKKYCNSLHVRVGHKQTLKFF